MNTESFYLPDHALIVQVIRESVSFEGLVEMRKREIDAGWIRPGTNTLLAIMTQAFAIERSDLDLYSQWASENLTAIEGSQSAILVNTPILTAISVLLKDTLSGIRLIEIFSTLNHAAIWLNVPKAAILAAAPEVRRFDDALSDF